MSSCIDRLSDPSTQHTEHSIEVRFAQSTQAIAETQQRIDVG
jgi:hypothetical protein